VSGKAVRWAWTLQREDRVHSTAADRSKRAADNRSDALARKEAKEAAELAGVRYRAAEAGAEQAARWTLTLERRRQIKLPAATHHVLVSLADHFDDKTHVAWPSQERISDSTGMSVRNVQRALEELELQGLIVVRPRLMGGRKIGVEYELPLYDEYWVAERIAADYDQNGHYDPDLAAENKQFMPSITDPPEADWEWLDAATVGPRL